VDPNNLSRERILVIQNHNQRLSQISTMWTVLRQAHDGPADAAAQAQHILLQRYGGAVHRYLLAILRDPHAADDLTQEFGLSLVKGAFHKAVPQRGRFREYVKTVLFHLVSKYHKSQTGRARVLAPNSPELASLASRDDDAERQFQESWREELLVRAWEALAEAQPTFYAVLRLRATHPKLPSPELAKELSGQLGKAFRAAGIRQILRRARDKFAELLIDEVAQTLERPTVEVIAQELRELHLLAYCQPTLSRYSGGPDTAEGG
jgi:RNA polymerase sigma factor (sigma-70 family)